MKTRLFSQECRYMKPCHGDTFYSNIYPECLHNGKISDGTRARCYLEIKRKNQGPISKLATKIANSVFDRCFQSLCGRGE